MVANLQVEAQNLRLRQQWQRLIEKEMARLEKRARRPIENVRIELLGTRHHRRGAFEIHFTLKHGPDMLVVKRQGEEMTTLINDAFHAMERQLDERVARRQQFPDPDAEAVVHSGKIARIVEDRSFGFIKKPNGEEVYFHLNAVKNGVAEPGTEVRFGIGEGEKGPQAVWVRII